jgi:hypothetical protein
MMTKNSIKKVFAISFKIEISETCGFGYIESSEVVVWEY